VKSHRDLEVWKKAIELAKTIYEVTGSFPKEELFGLATQMRRASVSVASNIAEGAARQGEKEFMRFLHLALGSASEIDTQIEISIAIGMGDKRRLEELQVSVSEVSRMLHGLIRFLRNKQSTSAEIVPGNHRSC
jgi:four helix bundle protein